MKTEHALRYLLLRHLKRRETCTPPARFLEVTRSLHVEPGPERYVVTWRADGAPHERTFERGEFVFYRRGDVEPRPGAGGPEPDRSEERAAAFAAEALPGPDPGPPAPEPLEAYGRRGILEMVLLAAAVAPGGGLGLARAAVLLAAGLAERLSHGRVYASLLLVPLAALGSPHAALLGALAYGLLQLLDPDPAYRRTRVALCGLAAAAAVGDGSTAGGGPPVGWVVTIGLVALGTAVARACYAVHFRALPLALPFYCVGRARDGDLMQATAGLAVLLAFTVLDAYGHRWWPVQREHVAATR